MVRILRIYAVLVFVEHWGSHLWIYIIANVSSFWISLQTFSILLGMANNP